MFFIHPVQTQHDTSHRKCLNCDLKIKLFERNVSKICVQSQLILTPDMKSQKWCVLVILSVGLTNASFTDNEWRDFKMKFKKSYDSSKEEAKKFAIFRENLDFITKHNQNRSTTFLLEMNRDGDMNQEEIAKELENLG